MSWQTFCGPLSVAFEDEFDALIAAGLDAIIGGLEATACDSEIISSLACLLPRVACEGVSYTPYGCLEVFEDRDV